MKTWRVTICIVLIVCVLAMSLSVFADSNDDNTPQETFDDWYVVTASDVEDSWQALGVYGVWLILNGMGIRITVNDVYEWSDTIYEALEEEILEFLNLVPSVNYTQWILPWQMGFTATGLFQGNSSMLEDVEDFANWLRSKYQLQDNSEYTLNVIYAIPTENMGGIPVYIPLYVTPDTYAWNVQLDYYTNFFEVYSQGFVVNQIYELSSGYYCRFYDNGTSVKLQISLSNEFVTLQEDISLISGNEYTWFKRTYESSTSGDNYNGTGKVPCFTYSPNGGPTAGQVGYKFAKYAKSYRGSSSAYTLGYVQAIDTGKFNLYFLPSSVSTEIQTAVITLPVDDPSYTSGDGVTVIGDSNVYGVYVINPIEVKNLPAVILQNNIPDIGNDEDNPGFSVPWQAINGLIQYVAAPAGAIMALVNEAPVEGVIMLYALIGGMIIFGMIRIMREH